jgi:hypothetical protein
MGPAIAFEVENFETAVAELKAAGVPFAMEPLETPVCVKGRAGEVSNAPAFRSVGIGDDGHGVFRRHTVPIISLWSRLELPFHITFVI